jgi:hypothetical protein
MRKIVKTYKENLQDEKGVVLVIVLVMLIMVIIASLMVFTDVITGIKVIGNERLYVSSSNIAEAAATYVQDNDARMRGNINFVPGKTASNYVDISDRVNGNAGIVGTTVQLREQGPGSVLNGSGDSALHFKSEIFDVLAAKDSQIINVGYSLIYLDDKNN